MDTNDHLLTWTSWYRKCWNRLPMVLGTWIGLVLAIYTTLTGYGWHLAQSRLPESRAAAIARNLPAVPDEENAAVICDQAVAAVVPWNALCKRMPERNWTEMEAPDRLKQEELLDAKIYAAETPLRIYVTINADAIRLATEASKRNRVDWGIRAEELPAAPITRLIRVNQLVKLLCQDALLAAHDGERERAMARLHAAAALVDHMRTSVSLMPHLFAAGLDTTVARNASTLLVLQGQRVDDDTLNQVRLLATTRAVHRWNDLLRIMQDEEAISLQVMDHMGSGDLKPLGVIPHGQMTDVPLPVSFYSASYIWDRAAFVDLMRDSQDALRSRMSGTPPSRPLMDPERAYYLDPRLSYGRLSGKLLTGLLMPVQGITINQELGREMRWRMLHLGLGLRDWIKRNGRIPNDFAATDIPAGDVVDLMHRTSKKAVLFRREDGGCLRVWSVGDNQKDDTTDPPAGKSTRNDDIFVLIPLPDGLP